MSRGKAERDRFIAMCMIAKRLGLAVVCSNPSNRAWAKTYGVEVAELEHNYNKDSPGWRLGYSTDALIMEGSSSRHRIGLVRKGETGTSSPFGEDALTHREFMIQTRSAEYALDLIKSEAFRQQQQIKVVEAPVRHGTNIDERSKEMYEWIRTLAKEGTVLTKEGVHRLALFSCFVDGDPTVALCDVAELTDAEEWKIRPLLIVPTKKMVLTDHEGKPSTPLDGGIDA